MGIAKKMSGHRSAGSARVAVGTKIVLQSGRVVFEVTGTWLRKSDNEFLFNYRSENGAGCNLKADDIRQRMAMWLSAYKSANILEVV